MPVKNIAVFGIFPDQLTAEDAVESLKETGFRSIDISVLFPDNQGARDFAYEKHTKMPEGITAGGSSGAVIGGALGWLAGIGALAIPGLGHFIAAGPLMAVLGGVGIGSALGGITGAFIGLGIPEYEAKRYEGRIQKGSILLSVHCDDKGWSKRARNILIQSGGEDVSSMGESTADFGSSDWPERRSSLMKPEFLGKPKLSGEKS